MNSFCQLLLLLSGDINLNPGPVHQGTWILTVCYQKSRNFVFIAKSTNAAVIESKLDTSMLEQEISIDNYKILHCDRNRHGGGVACYIRND